MLSPAISEKEGEICRLNISPYNSIMELLFKSDCRMLDHNTEVAVTDIYIKKQSPKKDFVAQQVKNARKMVSYCVDVAYIV